jgi:hypothetical protein
MRGSLLGWWGGSLLSLVTGIAGPEGELINLAAEATVSTPHASQRTTRTSIKATTAGPYCSLSAGQRK